MAHGPRVSCRLCGREPLYKLKVKLVRSLYGTPESIANVLSREPVETVTRGQKKTNIRRIVVVFYFNVVVESKERLTT